MGQAFRSWTPETFEQTGETPQDAFREVEIEALVVQYAKDWMIKLFCPVGLPSVLEGDIQVLMKHRHQPYDAIMRMPCARRRRLVAAVLESLKR